MKQDGRPEERGAAVEGGRAATDQERFEQLGARLGQIEAKLDRLLGAQPVRDYYTTAQAAGLLGLAEFTVREWCRHGRIRGEKRRSGRGAHYQWVISRTELQRYEREGLLPPRRTPS